MFERKYNNIQIINPEIYSSVSTGEYIQASSKLNSADSFSFDLSKISYPKNLDSISELDLYLDRLDYKEKDKGGSAFKIVFVPSKIVEDGTEDMTIADMGILGTMGEVVYGSFPKIYSNWQLDELDSEPILKNKVESGWYLISTGTMTDFCNLSYEEQLQKLVTHPVNNILQKQLYASGYDLSNQNLVAPAECMYVASCLAAIAATDSVDVPMRNGFVRTSSKFNDGTRIGVLGSSFGIDIDGFWSGEGPGQNISLSFCIKL